MQEKSSRRITPSAVSAFFVLSYRRWCGTVPARWLRVRESSSAWPSDGGIGLRWSEMLVLWIPNQQSRCMFPLAVCSKSRNLSDTFLHQFFFYAGKFGKIIACIENTPTHRSVRSTQQCSFNCSFENSVSKAYYGAPVLHHIGGLYKMWDGLRKPFEALLRGSTRIMPL